MSDYIAALPDEVVAEAILWRLPVKSIMQCRCVCKSWNTFITSRNFISNHLRRKTLTKTPQMLVFENDFGSESCVMMFDYEDYFRSISFQIPHPPHHDSKSYIRIIGSVNGLICFSISHVYDSVRIVNLVICNPSIGHFQSIPPPNTKEDWRVRGFGFDERTLDFNILLISDRAVAVAFIYSLNSNSWRRSTCNISKDWGMKCHFVLFVKGKFHWLAFPYGEGPRNFMMVFDVETEILIKLPLAPLESSYGPLDFMEFGESSIAIVNRFHKNHIWIMEEYYADESWIKYTIAPNLEVLGFRSNDQVLIRCNDGCIASRKINNTKSKLEERKRIMEVDKSETLSFSVHKYVPTLVLLDKQNNIDVPAPTHTVVDVTAQTLGKRTQIADVNETPTAETARRSQRIKHKAAKYT